MINIVNEKPLINPLTVDERKSILQRALNATPFLHLLKTTVPASFPPLGLIWKSKSHIGLDFFLTEIRGKFGDEETISGGIFTNVNIYLASSGLPVYGYNRGDLLPHQFFMIDCPGLSRTIFDDRQREFIPFPIYAGDDVLIEITLSASPSIETQISTVLCGFNGISYPYLTEIETEKINKSLEHDTVFQTFRLGIPATAGKRIFNINNDNTPRIVLGFGVVDKKADLGVLSTQATIDVYDAIRHIRLTSEPIPLQFLAPRIPVTLDQHIYYLPIEHYFVPFGTLRFSIENFITNVAPDEDPDYELVMLTRTV